MAILVDFSNVIISNTIVSLKQGDFPTEKNHENFIRKLVLNSLKNYRKRFHKEYGELILCCDCGSSWRKKIFPQYKAKRKENQKKDKQDWNKLFKYINNITDELEKYFPYKLIRVKHAEGDDIIASIIFENLIPKDEKIMIISSDKDLVQLQLHKNVKQWSPLLKKQLSEKNPRKFLFEHIVRGDRIDGIPNILSDADCFVKNKRQKAISKKLFNEWYKKYSNNILTFNVGFLLRFYFNEKLIDLTKIQFDIKENILDEYKLTPKCKNKSKLLSYFIKYNLNQFMLCMGEF